MARRPNTTSSGGNFDLVTVQAVWNKGRIVPGYDPNYYRLDPCGWWMARIEYGLTTEHGWEIDHIKPVAKNGSDDLANLQPLNWQNNRSKSDNYPNWSCANSAVK